MNTIDPVKAKRIEAGDTIATTGGVRKVLRSTRQGDKQEIVIATPKGEKTFTVDRNHPVGRIGVTFFGARMGKL